MTSVCPDPVFSSVLTEKVLCCMGHGELALWLMGQQVLALTRKILLRSSEWVVILKKNLLCSFYKRKHDVMGPGEIARWLRTQDWNSVPGTYTGQCTIQGDLWAPALHSCAPLHTQFKIIFKIWKTKHKFRWLQNLCKSKGDNLPDEYFPRRNCS